MNRAHVIVAFFAALGVLAGVGAFTFGYAKGFSYLSSDPRACVNCHIMNDQYDAWLKSGHRHAATCVECHLTASGVAKWLDKAEHGFAHSVAFTLQNFKEPIQITARDRVTAQENCLRCHGDLVQAVHRTSGSTGQELDCMHCHSGVGHGVGG